MNKNHCTDILSSPIKGFDGEHRFLSNFYESIVKLDGISYPTVEHAYQAAKTLDLSERKTIKNEPSPGRAKRLGRKVTLRKDWENNKISVMKELLKQKFLLPELRQMLLETGNSLLEETNSWGDTYWGVCNGHGKNVLGKLLMEVRQEITQELKTSTDHPASPKVSP